MIPNELITFLEIAAILLTLAIIFRSLNLIKKGKEPITVALFMFAMVSFMFSLSYWLAYNLIRPDSRMPFAANEIGEIAMLLLLASVLETAFRGSSVSAKKEIFLTIIFAASSVALWIGWSGEWIQDILFGTAFGYFLCTCVRSMKQADALNNNEWFVLGIFGAVLIICQAGTFFIPEGSKKTLDYFCYILMFSFQIWIFSKSIIMLKNSSDTKAILSLAFFVCAFSFSTLYMSSEWFYLAALMFCLGTLPLMLFALKKEVAE